MRGHSGSIGSFTLRIISASRHTLSASGAMVAPTRVYSVVGESAAFAGTAFE